MTDNSLCERWIALSNRQALGNLISRSEREFMAEHERACEGCAVEARVWATLASARRDEHVLELPPLGAGNHPETRVTEDRRGPGSNRRSSTRWPGRQRWASVAIPALATAAAAFGVYYRTTQTVAQPESGHAALVAVSGSVDVGSHRVAAGLDLASGERVQVSTGRACLVFDHGITTCLSNSTSAEVTSASAEHRSLSISFGHLLAKLDHQLPGSTFRVDTTQGSVTAKGTVFAVEVAKNQETSVRVHEGTVLLATRDGQQRLLSAPGEGRIGRTIEVTALPAGSDERDQALIQLSQLWSASSTSKLEVRATPVGAQVLLDGLELGPAPVSLQLSGAHRLEVMRAGYAPVSERLLLRGTETLNRNYDLVPLTAPEAKTLAEPSRAPEPTASAPAASTPAASTGADAPAPTPSELLSRARSLRAAHRFNEAAAAYHRLMVLHPRSDEARATLVSLAELELSELGDPAAALRSFDAYLRRSGGLTQEARYGRIRALGKLGRRADEQRAIEQFLKDYPHSVQEATLRAKLRGS